MNFYNPATGKRSLTFWNHRFNVKYTVKIESFLLLNNLCCIFVLQILFGLFDFNFRLSPIMPNLKAGCAMADMINLQQLREFKSKYPNIPTVCYINSTAEVKSECDICCTSSNAVQIVKSLNAPKVLFLPDKNLGRWVEKQLGNVEVITYNGYCPVHAKFDPFSIRETAYVYRNALVLAHPECPEDFSSRADYVGSTSGIMNFVKNSNEKQFIVATEKGVIDRLKRDNPNKQFYYIHDVPSICQSMKLNTVLDIYYALKNETPEIEVDKEISEKALKCINRMLEVSK